MNIKSFFYTFCIAIASAFTACDNNATNNSSPLATDSTVSAIPAEIAELNQQLKSNPDNAELYYKRAQFYMNTKKYSQGLADMLIAVNIDSTNANYFLTLSDFYFIDNQTSKTKAALERCIALDDKNTEALLKLAELYLYVRKYEESIKYINMALKIDQYNAKGYFMKGMNYKELKDTTRAISSMQTAVEQDQQYYNAFVQLGMLCAAKKNPLAIEYYKNAVKINPKSIEALYSLAKYYQDTEAFPKAIEAYNNLLKIESKSMNTYYNLGVIHLINLKKYDEALNYFSTAIQINPKYVQAYYGRALCYQAKGDKKNALLDFEACVNINPQFEPAIQELKKNKK
ncbi:MAG: tetratricopeptide repeat protein [Bacteroidia bacterium]